jgi:hypothetical protein
MTRSSLPDWAEAAIDAMDAQALRPQLLRRWHEIEIDVIPYLAELQDIGKSQLLDSALYAPDSPQLSRRG